MEDGFPNHVVRPRVYKGRGEREDGVKLSSLEAGHEEEKGNENN